MTLIPCTDRAAAAWITRAQLPWQQLVTFGPSGFAAYARLRFVPDSQYFNRSETSAVGSGDGLSEAEQLQVVVSILKGHSRTPDDLYFGFWEGAWGANFSGTKVDVRNRSYYLFRGSVSKVGEWTTSSSDNQTGEEPIPAFIWPTDHAWCVANDVDPNWAGIGAGVKAIHQLMADPRLDVVLADPTQNQPGYK